jgi:calcium/calmodulin-dependent protein kinase (CaM kinase) II
MADFQVELLALSQRLLQAIDTQDWNAYVELCDPRLTAFEPEGLGHLISGMPFHQFYFQMEGSQSPKQSSISSPEIRMMGDAAVVTYVRLVQRIDMCGEAETSASNETRVWQKQAGGWKHVHFHRSPC